MAGKRYIGHRQAIHGLRAPKFMAYARSGGFTVITHDLDFGSLLATTNASGPSVIQLRLQDVTPSSLEAMLVPALRQFQPELEAGALIVDARRMRARILPLKP